MLEVRANVFNLYIPKDESIKHDRLVINRLPNYFEKFGHFDSPQTVSEDHSNATATCVIDVPSEIASPEDATRYAQDYVRPYSRLLSFAQDHDVFFYSFKCFKPDTSDPLYTTLSSIHVGKSKGAAIIDSLPEFLNVAIPILRNESIAKKSTIDHALIAFNEVSNYDLPLELKVSLYFVGIETLANGYWSGLSKDARKTSFFETPIWALLRKKIDEHLVSMKIEKSIHDAFLSAFCEVKDPPIRDKIQLLCESFNLKNYASQIRAVNLMRNAFAHGNTTESEYGGMQIGLVAMCAERLLAKLILKSLKFYDSPAVHPSFVAEDLFAE